MAKSADSEAREEGRIVGVLLAGGESRRMGGGDKTLRPLGDRTVLAHVVARAAPQVDRLILNANGDPARFADYRLPVVADAPLAGAAGEGGRPAGPLAGVLTGMEWAAENESSCRWIATFATDAPFLPTDLVTRLLDAVGAGADMACARSGGRDHPVFGLWPVGLRADLRAAMEEGVRKVDVWTGRFRLAVADFPAAPVDPFFNTNRPEDLAEAERLLAGSDGAR